MFLSALSQETKDETKRGLMNAYLMHQLSQQDPGRSQLSFLDLLRLTSNFEVLVAHDSIYAILGIPSQHSGPGSLFPKPDYGMSQEILNIRVFQRIFRTHTNVFELLSPSSKMEYFLHGFRDGRISLFRVSQDLIRGTRGSAPLRVRLMNPNPSHIGRRRDLLPRRFKIGVLDSLRTAESRPSRSVLAMSRK